MTTTTETKFCCACGKYKAYLEGMCWGCHAEYKRHEKDFSAFGDAAEDIGYGKVQQDRAERRLK